MPLPGALGPELEVRPKPLLEPLEELRFRLIKSLAAVVLGAVVSYWFVDGILAVLSRPVGRFIFLQPTEAFFVRLKIALASGIVLAMPVIIYQVWKFVVVALTPLEKKSMFWVLPASYILFVCGTSFGFFVLVPAGMKFLLGYASPLVQPALSIEYYINFVGTVCLVLGAIFQMPLVSFFLGRFGIVEAAWLSSISREASLVTYVASAFLTPGPDPVTALLLALPTYLLFECSILAAKAAAKSS